MKDYLGNSISDTVKDFLKGDDDNYSGKYIGVVLDNNDPLQFGRCKIRVHGLHDDILTDYLPWAMPEFSLAFSIKGSFMVPEIGTMIYVEFDNGDLYMPIYGTKVIDRMNLNFSADALEDYPDSVILYESKNGDYYKINRNRGELSIKSGSGVFLKWSQNGDINWTNNSTGNGDVSFTFRGDYTLESLWRVQWIVEALEK